MSVRVAYIFPGQGPQYSGMGHDLIEDYIEAQHVAQTISRAFIQAGAPFNAESVMRCGDAPLLERTEYVQCAVFSHATIAFEVFKSQAASACVQIDPVITFGHSLGELMANVAAGTIDRVDMAQLVFQRGSLMQKAPDGALLNIERMSRQEVLRLVTAFNSDTSQEEDIYLAISQGPKLNAVGGLKCAMAKFARFLEEGAVEFRFTTGVAKPLHTPYMSAIIPDFRGILTTKSFQAPSIPLLANATGRPYAGEAVIENLLSQIDSEVKFKDLVDHAKRLEPTLYLVFGPGIKIKELLTTYNGIEESRVRVLERSEDIRSLISEFA